jgi:hypothetical protein
VRQLIYVNQYISCAPGCGAYKTFRLGPPRDGNPKNVPLKNSVTVRGSASPKTDRVKRWGEGLPAQTGSSTGAPCSALQPIRSAHKYKRKIRGQQKWNRIHRMESAWGFPSICRKIAYYAPVLLILFANEAKLRAEKETQCEQPSTPVCPHLTEAKTGNATERATGALPAPGLGKRW